MCPGLARAPRLARLGALLALGAAVGSDPVPAVPPVPPSEPGRGHLCARARPHRRPALTPLSPAGRSQRSPQAAGLAEILPEGRGALQHPQLDVAQARGRQRGAGGGGAELPAEQPDVSPGPGPGARLAPRPPPAPPAPSRSVACFGVFCTEEIENSSNHWAVSWGVFGSCSVFLAWVRSALWFLNLCRSATDFFCTFAPLFLKYR